MLRVQLASCGRDRLVIIWDTEGGAALHQLVGHQLSARACDWDPSGMRLVTAGADGKLLMWDADAGTAVLELEGLQGDTIGAAHVAFLKSSPYLAVTSSRYSGFQYTT